MLGEGGHFHIALDDSEWDLQSDKSQVTSAFCTCLWQGVGQMHRASPLDPVPSFHSLAPRKTEEEEEEELEETAQEKKLRLAKLYLEQLKQQGELGELDEGRGLCQNLPAVPVVAPAI